MGIPILTSEGFVGQRWIVNDYFRAGETLHAGDVVAFQQGPRQSAGRVWKISERTQLIPPHTIRWTPDSSRVIGIVHTPEYKQVGDRVAQGNGYVPIVIEGIAKALSNGSIGVGDPVIPSRDTGTGPGGNSVARVAESPSEANSIVGRCLTVTTEANEEVDILVDLAGTYPITSSARVIRTSSAPAAPTSSAPAAPTSSVPTAPTSSRPAAPTNLRAIPGNRWVIVQWDNVNLNDYSITGYKIRARSGTNEWGAWSTFGLFGASLCTYIYMSLTNGTPYSFEVRVLNAHGEGPSGLVGPVTPTAF